jgi:uncharacterized protein YodC (DUF2158 family)
MEDKTMNIKAGDVVKLKSGGPKMTVAKIVPGISSDSKPLAECFWFGGDGAVAANKFDLDILKQTDEEHT